jgi:hypothetical protein
LLVGLQSQYIFIFTDILTKNLVTAAINWDKSENFNKPPCKRTNLHLDSLIATINSCGVSFKVWEKKNANGGASGTYDLPASWVLIKNSF